MPELIVLDNVKDRHLPAFDMYGFSPLTQEEAVKWAANLGRETVWYIVPTKTAFVEKNAKQEKHE